MWLTDMCGLLKCGILAFHCTVVGNEIQPYLTKCEQLAQYRHAELGLGLWCYYSGRRNPARTTSATRHYFTQLHKWNMMHRMAGATCHCA